MTEELHRQGGYLRLCQAIGAAISEGGTLLGRTLLDPTGDGPITP